MKFDEEAFMNTLDRWDSRVRRDRFLKKMERKLYKKQNGFGVDR